MGTLALAFVAGVLSTLSPCVLPLLPVVLGAAVSEHRLGPAALAAGLAASFVAVGLFVALVGFSIGLDTGVFRAVAAGVLVAVGAVLMVPKVQAQLAVVAGPVGNWTEQRFGGFSRAGIGGQFAVGLLLGAVWSPCAGPTLGAASVLAAQGSDLAAVAATMFVFGTGAALPLLVLGLVSRQTLMRSRDRLLRAGHGAKLTLGALLVASGLLVMTGLDKTIEAYLVDISPAWLDKLTTRF